MPYIEQKARRKFDDLYMLPKINTKGELEYCIFTLMKLYMEDKEKRYSTLHDCTYAAQHCADEFRRRYLDKREDRAMNQNGDITPLG